MPTYVYEAIDATGKAVKDEIEASSDKDANDKIRSLNLHPTRLSQKGGGGGAAAVGQGKRKRGFHIGGVSRKQLTQFTRQFATLLDAGLPIVRSIDVLYNQLRPGLMKDTVADVKEDVESGSALSESLSKHPRVFDKLYVNMIRAGEAGGVVPEILARLADYMEKSQRLKQKIIGALVYPIAVMVIATAILSLIMIFIIPQFEAMFKEMELGNLPQITEILLTVANAVKDHWYLIPATPVLIWFMLFMIGRTPKGRYTIDLIKLKFPIFGLIISKSSVSRFARTLGTLIQSGVPILQALTIIKNATGNAVVAGAVESVHNSVREGDTIADPLRHSGVFDDMVVNMVQVGEETGELDRMLLKIADTYDNEVDTLVGALMSLLEPILIIAMGGTVGFIVIALFMPLIAIMERIGSGRA